MLLLPPGSAHTGGESEREGDAASLNRNSDGGRRAACSPACVHAAAALSRWIDGSVCVISRGVAVRASGE